MDEQERNFAICSSKNAKTNISLLSKVTKGPRYGKRPRPLKRKDKSLQNTVPESEFIYFGRPNDVRAEDEEILRLLGDITFTFAWKHPTIREAELLFLYRNTVSEEAGHAIGLSEVYGAIFFRIPEDLVKRISDQAAVCGLAFEDYLCYLVEYPPEEFGPEYADPVPDKMAEVAAKMEKAADALQEAGDAAESLAGTIYEIGNFVRDILEEQEHPDVPEEPSNNWLRMHGQAARRTAWKKHWKGKCNE